MRKYIYFIIYLAHLSHTAILVRYANNSNYKNDTMIRKEAYVHKAVMEELRRIIEDSEVSQPV